MVDLTNIMAIELEQSNVNFLEGVEKCFDILLPKENFKITSGTHRNIRLL